MGADFIYAMAIVPTEDEALLIRKKIAEIADEDSVGNPDCLEIHNFDIMEYREHLNYCLDQLMAGGGRDAGGFHLGDRFVVLTGGMSFGDTPSDLCQYIWDLENEGVLLPNWDDFEFKRKAIDPELLEEARAFLDKMVP